MLLPLQFPRCQRKDVNIREEDSSKFTVDVMQDEKVIAVKPISRSLWFAGEDHVQITFSFGDILLSQLSVVQICQYSKSTGLFAVTMLHSHTSCDQSVEGMLACQSTTAIYPIHKTHDLRTLHGISNVSAIQCGSKGGTYTKTKEGQAASPAGRKSKTKEGATTGSTEVKTA